MKIATWNVNSIKVRLPQVLNWLLTDQPDVLALQETKTLDENFPLAEIAAAGYQSIFSGQKSYNGVAILSRHPTQDILKDIPDLIDPQRRILVATINGIRVINLYVPNGESVDSEKYLYKLDWLQKVKAFIQQQQQKYKKIIILGDFNIAPEERDIHDPISWQDSVLFSEPERNLFKEILNLGFFDAFRLHTEEDKHYTWWDYRMGSFHRNQGARIDHILISEALKSNHKNCHIDKIPRKHVQPSDHTIIFSELVS